MIRNTLLKTVKVGKMRKLRNEKLIMKVKMVMRRVRREYLEEISC